MKPLRVRWRKGALADLQRYRDWLTTIDGAQPGRVIARIRTTANTMRRLGDIGRRGGKPGTRELTVRNAPYVIVYVVDDDVADILAVYHTAEDR